MMTPEQWNKTYGRPTPEQQQAIMNQAADILTSSPFEWKVTVEYPGYVAVVTVADGDEPRYYAAGFANDTLTVDQQTRDGEHTTRTVDTHVPVYALDGYRFAIHVAAAIDRM